MATSKHTIRADFALGFGRDVKTFGSQVKWPDYDTMHQVVQYSDGQERRYKLKQRIVDKSGDVAPFAMYYDEIFKEWLDSDVAAATLLAHDEPAIRKKPAARVAKKKPAAKDEEDSEDTKEEEDDGERDDIDDSAPCAAAGPKAAKASLQYIVLYYKKAHQASIRQGVALGGKQIGSVGGKASTATEAQLRDAASRTIRRLVAKTITERQCKNDMAEQLRDIVAPHLD
jgi:hypothetical protein